MRPTDATYVVLGLLAKRPGSGYDLAAFADRSVRHFWPISRSQLYAELCRLEELGWASGTTVQQERYPNKRVFQTTPVGLEALRGWLDAEPRWRARMQEEVVLKAFLGAYMSRDRLAAQLLQYREEADKQRALLTAVVEHLDAKGPGGPHIFGRATARFGILQAEATIAWTDEVRALLAADMAHGSSDAVTDGQT